MTGDGKPLLLFLRQSDTATSPGPAPGHLPDHPHPTKSMMRGSKAQAGGRIPKKPVEKYQRIVYLDRRTPGRSRADILDGVRFFLRIEKELFLLGFFILGFFDEDTLNLTPQPPLRNLDRRTVPRFDGSLLQLFITCDGGSECLHVHTMEGQSIYHYTVNTMYGH